MDANQAMPLCYSRTREGKDYTRAGRKNKGKERGKHFHIKKEKLKVKA